jgi:hypothetical protein
MLCESKTILFSPKQDWLDLRQEKALYMPATSDPQSGEIVDYREYVLTSIGITYTFGILYNWLSLFFNKAKFQTFECSASFILLFKLSKILLRTFKKFWNPWNIHFMIRHVSKVRAKKEPPRTKRFKDFVSLLLKLRKTAPIVCYHCQ